MNARQIAALLCLPLITSSGCASFGTPRIPVIESGWTREELRTKWLQWDCQPTRCNRTWRTASGPIVLETRVKAHGLHEIPGWGIRSTAGRVVEGIFFGLLRRQGLTTERVVVGHGTRTITDSGATRWQLRCSVYWIDDEEQEYDKDESDHVVAIVRRSEGAVCRAVDLADTSVIRWRFSAGIAPPRDSLAVRYDSVRTVNPDLVSAVPPMRLERLDAAGAVEQGYALAPDIVHSPTEGETIAASVRISREPGAPPIAVVHSAVEKSVLVSSTATAEEIRIFRLLAALMAVSFQGAG